MNNNEQKLADEKVDTAIQDTQKLAENTESDTAIQELVDEYQEYTNEIVKDLFVVNYNVKDNTIVITIDGISLVTYQDNGFTVINFENTSGLYKRYKAFMTYYLNKILN